MSKQIKLIIATIITIFTIALLAGSVNAFSPANQTPIYPQVQGGHWYFCKEKGGPIRFTQFSPSYYQETEKNNIDESAYEYAWQALPNIIKSKL